MERSQRRAQLLGVARDIIAADGADALSMNALAECADVTKPVVYSHFSNSQQVIVALLDDHYENMREYVREATESATTLDVYITQLLESAFDFERTNRVPVQKISNGYSSSPEVNEAFARYRSVFQKYWQDLLEQQGVPASTAEIAAFGFSSMVSETTTTYAPRPRSQKLARETLKKVVLAAIATLSTRPSIERPDVHVTTYAAPDVRPSKPRARRSGN